MTCNECRIYSDVYDYLAERGTACFIVKKSHGVATAAIVSFHCYYDSSKYKAPYALQCPVSVCVGGGEGCKGSLAWQATDGALFAPDTQPTSQRFFGAHGEISDLAEEGC